MYHTEEFHNPGMGVAIVGQWCDTSFWNSCNLALLHAREQGNLVIYVSRSSRWLIDNQVGTTVSGALFELTYVRGMIRTH